MAQGQRAESERGAIASGAPSRLQPHRTETLQAARRTRCSSRRSATSSGLYLHPPDRALVLCVDEKSQIQALDRTQPLLADAPGPSGAAHPRLHAPRHHLAVRRARHPHGRGHWATASAAIAAIEFRKFLDTIDAAVPADSGRASRSWTTTAPTRRALIRRWLAKRPRFHVHFTPTSASWLNLVERWFAALTEKQIKRGAHRKHARTGSGDPPRCWSLGAGAGCWV